MAEERAGDAGQPRGQQREGAGGAASGQVGADAGRGAAARGAPVGRAHAGYGAGVEVPVVGLRRVPRCVESRPYGLHESLPDPRHRVVGGELGRRDGERGRRLITDDVACAVPQYERVAGRHAPHPEVGRAVAERLRGVGAGEQRREVADVELGLGQVGERQGRGGVGGAAGPFGVEDGARPRQVAGDRHASADLCDRRITAAPRRQMPQCAPARRQQSDAQFLVARSAAAEDGEAGERVGLDDADLVRTPVPDGPERVGVAPQELRADRMHRGAVGPGASPGSTGTGPGGGTAPPHQPPHRRLHRVWTINR